MPREIEPEPPAEVDDEAARRAADVARLLEFLHNRDVTCPFCGYNLRNLTVPTCPECRQDLELSVDVRRLRLGWLLAAVVPSTFSGVAAVLLLVPIVIATVLNRAAPPLFVVLTELFGMISGIFGLAIVRRRHEFLALDTALQRHAAFATWTIHIGVFALLLLAVLG